MAIKVIVPRVAYAAEPSPACVRDRGFNVGVVFCRGDERGRRHAAGERPDFEINHSILVYQLETEDLIQAIDGPPVKVDETAFGEIRLNEVPAGENKTEVK